jgi:hypothetical protein
MKTILLATLAATALAGAAQAATYQAVFSSVTDRNGGLAAIGADPSASEMVVTWEMDDDPTPLTSAYSVSNASYTHDFIYLPYRSFSVSVGGVTLTGMPSTSTAERVFLRDGVADGTHDTLDQFQVASFTDQSLAGGVTLNDMLFTAYSYDETVFSGLDHPGEDLLDALDWQFGRIRLTLADGQAAYITASGTPDISAVPLPAGAPLLIGGIAALALMRRRKPAA